MKNAIPYIILFLLLFGLKNCNAQVINAGIGGNNTQNLLERLNKNVLDQKPDLVILMVVGLKTKMEF